MYGRIEEYLGSSLLRFCHQPSAQEGALQPSPSETPLPEPCTDLANGFREDEDPVRPL